MKVDEVGIIVTATLEENGTALDISGSTTRQLIFVSPTHQKRVFPCTFTTDGTEGKMQYTTLAGDLDVSGDWQIQAFVVLPGGSYYSQQVSVHVEDHL